MWKLSQGLLYALLIVLVASGAYARGGPLHSFATTKPNTELPGATGKVTGTHDPAGASICFRHAQQATHPGARCIRPRERSRPWR